MARFLLVSVVLGPRAAGRLPRSFVINLAELTISYTRNNSLKVLLVSAMQEQKMLNKNDFKKEE